MLIHCRLQKKIIIAYVRITEEYWGNKFPYSGKWRYHQARFMGITEEKWWKGNWEIVKLLR